MFDLTEIIPALYPQIAPETFFEMVQYIFDVTIHFIIIVLIFKFIFLVAGYITGKRKM